MVRLYSVWALGMMGDAGAVPTVIAESSAEDPGARKMAAYVLGKIGDRRAIPRLTAMTADHVADVRWNAAIALAELHDGGGKEVLRSMLDRRALARQAETLRPSQVEEAMINAAKAEAVLGDEQARPILEELARGDESLRVRDAARRAAEALKR
jgi:HEAT repeat protein